MSNHLKIGDKIMKTLNKMIAAMMMALTTTMPAMAGNKHHNDKNTTVVEVNNNRGGTHFDKVDRALSHHNSYKGKTYRPEVKTCTFKISRHDSHQKVVAKAEHMKGVMDTKWNPRTRELTVIYDAKIISARHIKHFVA